MRVTWNTATLFHWLEPPDSCTYFTRLTNPLQRTYDRLQFSISTFILVACYFRSGVATLKLPAIFVTYSCPTGTVPSFLDVFCPHWKNAAIDVMVLSPLLALRENRLFTALRIPLSHCHSYETAQNGDNCYKCSLFSICTSTSSRRTISLVCVQATFEYSDDCAGSNSLSLKKSRQWPAFTVPEWCYRSRTFGWNC